MRPLVAGQLSDRDLYWMGYFRADGTILSNYSGCFTQKLREPVLEFAKYLEFGEEKVFTYTSNRRLPGADKPTPYTFYKVTSCKLGRKYKALGIKGPDILDELRCSKHFWRGMIDGDGAVSFCANKVTVGLCGRHEDMGHFSEFCESVIDFRPKVYPKNAISQVMVGGAKARTLCKLLYDGEYSALEYKRLLAERAYQQ